MWETKIVAKEEGHLLPTTKFSVACVKPSQDLAALSQLWIIWPFPLKHTTSPLQTWVVFPQPVAPLTTITLFLFATSINADLY